MKKLLKILLCLILVFSLMPKEEAKAEGDITNIIVSGDTVTWDPYPGADYYLVGVGYFGYSAHTNSYEGLNDAFRDSGFGEGDYPVDVVAYGENDEFLAYGYSSNTYHYKPLNGQIAAPQNPRWVDDHTAAWDPVEGAEFYIVYIIRNGLEYDWTYSWEGAEIDLTPYMTEPGSKFAFTVKAHAMDYEDSPESVVSSEVDGLDAVLERIYGSGRYETSLKVAAKVKEIWGFEYFSEAVITTGVNYPDALSGSFLANRYAAPMLMINKKSAPDVVDYVKENVMSGGTIYILGGAAAVEEEWIQPLKDDGYDVRRLSGKNRYLTNLEILKEADVHDGTILVCTGGAFADSLSCSSLPYPILLVGKSLNSDQRAFLETLNKNSTWFFIIGGTGAVSAEIEAELGNYGDVVDRIAGKDRYETSVNIARTFTPREGKYVIATGKNFPDGLSGGPLAYALSAPLILVADGKTEKAAEFTAYPGVSVGYALGGTGALSEAVFNTVFHIMTESYQ